uniref:DDE-1 domain-containing protein n=1 Tax=Phytophthora ramorum TaxID=164328 RepID=H3H5J6_PHYRM
MPGGTVETDELPTYPAGHVYTVQESGWMDATVWQMYVMCLQKYEIDAPSVLMLDNFDSHVSEAGQNIVAEETSAIVCPVPANSTSVSQPLDVGVMGPLKKKLSAEWLRDKVSTTRTAKEKRIAAVLRTIRAWEDISAECVVRSFEKAIPKDPEVMV